MIVLRDKRGNKTLSSRFTRWVDRLLPFQFKVIHDPGGTIGKAEYLSRHPSDRIENDSRIKAEELWYIWFAVNGKQLIRNDTSVSANQIERGT